MASLAKSNERSAGWSPKRGESDSLGFSHYVSRVLFEIHLRGTTYPALLRHSIETRR